MPFCSRVSVVGALTVALTFPLKAQADTYTYGGVDDLPELDLAYGTRAEDLVYASLVCDSLFELAEDGSVRPLAAKSWEFSPDSKTLTISIRDDMTWSDGNPVTAFDYVNGFQRTANPAMLDHARPDYLLEAVQNAVPVSRGELPVEDLGVTAKDTHTLVFSLVRPTSYFLSILTYPALCAAPTHLTSTGTDWLDQVPLVSSGPYQLTEGSEELLRLTKREGHWFQPYFEEVVFKKFDTQDLAARELRAGLSDVSKEISGPAGQWIKSDPSLRFETMPTIATTYGIFNTLDERFADKNVRFALNQLLERQHMAKAVKAEPAFSFTPSALLEVGPPENGKSFQQKRSDRVTSSRALLQQAGYSASKPLEIEVLYIAAREYEAMANAIVSSWSIPEIKTTFRHTPTDGYSGVIRSNKFEFALAEWIGDYADPMTFLGLLRAGGVKNHSDWDNQEFVSLLDKALVETSSSKRQGLYKKMEEMLVEYSPITPLVHPSARLVRRNTIVEHSTLTLELNPRHARRIPK